MTRRKLLTSLIGASASAAAYPCSLEPRWLERTERRVRLRRPGVARAIRLVHLSDLHASFLVPMSTIDRAVTLAIESKPDLVCLTGDFITNRYDFDYDAYVRVLRRLSAAAPVYGVLGNHDGGVWAARNFGYADHRVVEKLIDESGIELLHNRSISIQAGGEPLSLVGVGDLQSGEINAQQAFAGVPANQPTILLSHNPDSKTVVCAHAWELMLSGHTHGGQVIVPFLGPRYAPVRDKRYVAGLKPWGTRQIHVTRGVGNVGGVRFRCRPEVSVLVVS